MADAGWNAAKGAPDPRKIAEAVRAKERKVGVSDYERMLVKMVDFAPQTRQTLSDKIESPR